jgi:hypothetical protein
VDLGLFRWLTPDAVSKDNLQKILSLNDTAALSRLAQLQPEVREFILNLPLDRLRDLSRRLTDKELTAFADYQRRLEPNAARRLLRATSERPTIMQELSSDGLRQAVLNSRDQLSALDMILNEGSWIVGYGRILQDVDQVRNGNVSYRVFWERYWLSVILAAFAALVVLSWLRRLLFGRPTVVIRESNSKNR